MKTTVPSSPFTFEREQAKNIIVAYFKARVSFELVDMILDIFDRCEDTLEETILEEVECVVVYAFQDWLILEHYCSPQEANWQEAWEAFVTDVLNLAKIIRRLA